MLQCSLYVDQRFCATLLIESQHRALHQSDRHIATLVGIRWISFGERFTNTGGFVQESISRNKVLLRDGEVAPAAQRHFEVTLRLRTAGVAGNNLALDDQRLVQPVASHYQIVTRNGELCQTVHLDADTALHV